MTLLNLDQVVYLAAPYSIGDKDTNVKRAIAAANTLIDMGYYVYNAKAIGMTVIPYTDFLQ